MIENFIIMPLWCILFMIFLNIILSSLAYYSQKYKNGGLKNFITNLEYDMYIKEVSDKLEEIYNIDLEEPDEVINKNNVTIRKYRLNDRFSSIELAFEGSKLKNIECEDSYKIVPISDIKVGLIMGLVFAVIYTFLV